MSFAFVKRCNSVFGVDLLPLWSMWNTANLVQPVIVCAPRSSWKTESFCETGIHETDGFIWARITTSERSTGSSNSHLMVIRASLSRPIQSPILCLVSADVTCVTKRIKLIHSCRLCCMLSGGDGRRRKETQEGAAGVDHGPGNRALHEHRRTGEELPPATSLISSRFVSEIVEVVRALPTVTLFVEELYICRFKILLSRILSVGSFARVSPSMARSRIYLAGHFLWALFDFSTSDFVFGGATGAFSLVGPFHLVISLVHSPPLNVLLWIHLPLGLRSLLVQIAVLLSQSMQFF